MGQLAKRQGTKGGTYDIGKTDGGVMRLRCGTHNSGIRCEAHRRGWVGADKNLEQRQRPRDDKIKQEDQTRKMR